MKTVKVTGKDEINLKIDYSERSGITSWEGSFWKKINLRRKNERVKLILGDMSWGFAFLTLGDPLTEEVCFYGDGALRQTSNTKGDFK